MAALTGDRNTMAKSQTTLNQYKVKASNTIWAGALTAIDATGLAVPAGTASSVVVGRANERGTAGATDPVWIKVQSGVYKWDNGTAGAAVVQATLGHVCYAIDDHTVGATGTIVAGIALQIDDDLGIWVQTEPSGGI